ncbi:MAG: type IV secretion system DNA-binding domain-containing protein [Candidatus Andersenbacteria bacterium]
MFAKTTFRGEEKAFGIKRDDRRKHVYVIGKTGMGKTTMLQNMIIGDIYAGNGVAIVDPHGDVSEDILDFIPDNRVNDVIYFNPADLEYPIAFNVFERVATEHKDLVASGLVGVFKKLYAESWGPRLEYILRNTLLALLDYPQATLLGVLRILVDKKYRNDVLEKITDPVVKSFWLDEFANYNEKFRTEAIAPIQNKVGQFLSSTVIRNIVGQVKSTFDLRDVMDNQKILILSMSKGKIGEDNAALLGSMMITKIQLAAMSRATIPEAERKDFYLYVDEFQNFATESFANILSEARKYRLNLTVAHQYIEQMSDEVRAAVFGNVGTLVVFRIGAEDAEFLEQEFDPAFLQADLVNLPAHNIYLKLMIDGLTSAGFSAVTLPRLEAYRTNNRAKIIKVSRERYGRPRKEVEDKIRRWAGTAFQEMAFGESGRFNAQDRMEQKMLRREYEKTGTIPSADDRELFNAVCETCNKAIKIPFKPDKTRAIYCRECLPAAQRQRDLQANRPPRPAGPVRDRRPGASSARPPRRDDRGRRRSDRRPPRPPAPALPKVDMRQALTKALEQKKQTPPKTSGRQNLREGDTVSL